MTEREAGGNVSTDASKKVSTGDFVRVVFKVEALPDRYAPNYLLRTESGEAFEIPREDVEGKP